MNSIQSRFSTLLVHTLLSKACPSFSGIKSPKPIGRRGLNRPRIKGSALASTSAPAAKSLEFLRKLLLSPKKHLGITRTFLPC